MVTTNKWEKFANDFEQKNNYVVGLKDINAIKHQIMACKDFGSLLELGCGNGTYTECFISSASKIVATDVSEKMVEVTKARFSQHSHVLVETADCFELPYPDNSFDTVFMANLLHVIPTPEKALAECHRVLKPNGKLMAVSFTLHGMKSLNKLLLKYRYIKMYGTQSAASSITMTPTLASELACLAGFQNIETQLIGTKVKAVYLCASKSSCPT